MSTAAPTPQKPTFVAPPQGSRVKLRPIGDALLIVPEPKGERREGNIILPETADRGPIQRGRVFAYGAKVEDPALRQEGVLIYHRAFGDNKIELNGCELQVIHENEVYLVVTPTDAAAPAAGAAWPGVRHTG